VLNRRREESDGRIEYRESHQEAKEEVESEAQANTGGAVCQFIFRILVKEFKSTFIAVPLSSHREESISLDLCGRVRRDNSATKLMHLNASIMTAR